MTRHHPRLQASRGAAHSESDATFQALWRAGESMGFPCDNEEGKGCVRTSTLAGGERTRRNDRTLSHQFENRVQNWYYMYVESCTYVGISLVLRTLDLQRHPAQLLPLCRGPGRGRQGPDRVHITTHPVCKSVSLRGWGRTVASHKSNWGRTAATDKKNLGGTVEERLEITQVHADCVLITR